MAVKEGDDIYVINSQSDGLVMDTVSLTNPSAENSIYVESTLFTANKVTMSGMGRDVTAEEGAGIMLVNAKGLQITESSFKGMKANKGAAIYVKE